MRVPGKKMMSSNDRSLFYLTGARDDAQLDCDLVAAAVQTCIVKKARRGIYFSRDARIAAANKTAIVIIIKAGGSIANFSVAIAMATIMSITTNSERRRILGSPPAIHNKSDVPIGKTMK